MTSIAFGKAEHILSIRQAIAMHMAVERQRQLIVGKSSVSHLSQASTIPVYRVCLRSRSECQLAINAALCRKQAFSMHNSSSILEGEVKRMGYLC